LKAHSAPPAEGGRIGDRYQLEELIGEGGMARVWRAKDLTLERRVAVKFLFLREGRQRATMLERFLREAQIAAAIRHPNVVGILDFGTTDEERPFMVMELLEGESLEERLVREPPLTLEELVSIASGALLGLAAVHKAGIVHRDLKPDNIFLVRGDDGLVPKLLDFGVSRDNDPTSGRRSGPPTGDGFLVGTPEYMSPEQARGLKDVDWRTDIYSVGVVLYEALSGRLPYRADAVGDLIIDIVSGAAPRVCEVRPEVGEPLSEVIARAMAPDRAQRFQSAREMREALAAAADVSLGHGVRPSLPTPVMRRAAATIDAPPELDVTPKAWSVEVSLPKKKRAVWPWAAAACAIPIATAGAWMAVDRDEAAAPRSLAQPQAIAAPQVIAPPPAPIAPVAPPSAPDEVTVTLRGLPSNARVRVDDRDVAVEDGAIAIARDEAEHEVSVHAPGRPAWRTTHVAERDGDYLVPQPPRRAPPPNVAPAPSEGVIRDLDY
jgi:serine/threonine protein kinase